MREATSIKNATVGGSPIFESAILIISICIMKKRMGRKSIKSKRRIREKGKNIILSFLVNSWNKIFTHGLLYPF